MKTRFEILEKTPDLLLKYIAEGEEHLSEYVNYKLRMHRASGLSDNQAIDATQSDITNFLGDYIDKDGNVDLKRLGESYGETKKQKKEKNRKSMPIMVDYGKFSYDEAKKEAEYGTFYSNAWNLMGKEIALEQQGKKFRKIKTNKTVKIMLQNEYSKGMFVLGEQRTGKSTLLKHLTIQLILSGISVVFFDPQGEQQYETFKENFQETIKKAGWAYNFPIEIVKCVTRINAKDIKFKDQDIDPLQLIYLSHKMFRNMSPKELEVLEGIEAYLIDKYGDDNDYVQPFQVMSEILSLSNKTNMSKYDLRHDDATIANGLKIKRRLQTMLRKVKTNYMSKTAGHLDIDNLCKPKKFVLVDKNGEEKTVSWGRIVIVDCSDLGDMGTSNVQSKVQLIAYNVINQIFRRRQEARLKAFHMARYKKVSPNYEFNIFPRVAVIIDEAQNYLTPYDDALSKAYLGIIQMGDKLSVGIIGVFRATGNIPPSIMTEARKFICFRVGITIKGNERLENKFITEGWSNEFRGFMGSGLRTGECVLLGFDKLYVEGGRQSLDTPLVVKVPPSPFEDLRENKDNFTPEANRFNI